MRNPRAILMDKFLSSFLRPKKLGSYLGSTRGLFVNISRLSQIVFCPEARDLRPIEYSRSVPEIKRKLFIIVVRCDM
jgi:hypothetical protein